MHFRRPLAIALGTVAMSALLIGCGFDAATDRPYTPAEGVNDQTGSVDVLNAVVVSTDPGSGTLVASISNNERSEDAVLDSIAPASDTSVEPTDFTPVEVPPGGMVNLADTGGVQVTGDFEAGDFVDVTFGFGSGERIAMTLPVVANAGVWAGLDGPAPSPSESPTETETGTETETETG